MIAEELRQQVAHLKVPTSVQFGSRFALRHTGCTPLVEAVLSAARLTRLAALGPPSLLAGQRSRRPAVAAVVTALARRRHTAAARLATVVVAAVIVATVVSRVAAAAVILTSALLPARCGADAVAKRSCC